MTDHGEGKLVRTLQALADPAVWMPPDLSDEWASSQPELEVLRADVARLRHYGTEMATRLAGAYADAAKMHQVCARLLTEAIAAVAEAEEWRAMYDGQKRASSN